MRSRHDEGARIHLEEIGKRTSGGSVELRAGEELALPLGSPSVEPGERQVRLLSLRLRRVRRQNGDEFELDGLRDVRPADEVVEIRLVASRDHLDDVPTIVQVRDPHDAGGIGVSGLDGVIDRDGRAPDRRGVTRPVQAEHHFTGALRSGHTGRQHRGADRRQAKNSHDSHEDQAPVACRDWSPNGKRGARVSARSRGRAGRKSSRNVIARATPNNQHTTTKAQQRTRAASRSRVARSGVAAS